MPDSWRGPVTFQVGEGASFVIGFDSSDSTALEVSYNTTGWTGWLWEFGSAADATIAFMAPEPVAVASQFKFSLGAFDLLTMAKNLAGNVSAGFGVVPDFEIAAFSLGLTAAGQVNIAFDLVGWSWKADGIYCGATLVIGAPPVAPTVRWLNDRWEYLSNNASWYYPSLIDIGGGVQDLTWTAV